ncbi:succinoglycan biosynthesis transport protein [Fulvimarina pelagi HTCC2506]|uniref:Succinoglycan biosynthesis transport protein n=1 Tax=Fulvimarina pelagi HTCC2506 TaxID=314231 RepID=Q0G547_9HYPH|nr:lipopolysaccharide biosynthesis protein [Fulvimarina pelagi]EAU43217.1 succinoglycan biosynthesis transport protein [Fulvimarina pelagi HTCC2506]
MKRISVLRRTLKANLSILRDYASLISGSLGRLVLSLGYFVCIANGLSIGDFGLFATASATGVMLSRIASLGFYSPLYRAATVKPHLIGTYTAGYIAASVLSLPLVLLAASILYLMIFAGEMSLAAFGLVIAAEIVGWRTLEIVIIVNNGIGRFGRGAIVTIFGVAVKALAAIGFWFLADGALLTWAIYYLGANMFSAAIAAAITYPRQRLRFQPKLYVARWRDSVSVSGADMVFYLQSDLDKLLVLAFGGPAAAGIYAIIMRLVDLTALPMRSFNTLIVQKIMKVPAFLDSWARRVGIEAAIAFVSTTGLLALGGFLWVFPTALGENVADAAPFILLALAVPAFRNLVEYQAELLYARGKTTIRVAILALCALLKAGLLAAVLVSLEAEMTWIVMLNGVFALLWLTSATASYAALDWRGWPGIGERRTEREATALS